jgi:hypothetical protein
MTRPGALESKKRCHDLLHRDSDNRDFLVKKYAFSGRTRIYEKSIDKLTLCVNSGH